MSRIAVGIAILLICSTVSFAQSPTPTPTPGAEPITDMSGRWDMQFYYVHISDNPDLSGKWMRWDASINTDDDGRVSGSITNPRWPDGNKLNGNGTFSCVFVTDVKCRGRSGMSISWDDSNWIEFWFSVDSRNTNTATGEAHYSPKTGGLHKYRFVMTRR